MTKEQQQIIDLAISILESTFKERADFNNSKAVADYLRLRISHLEHEVFLILLLDVQHKLIEAVELFRGTIDGAAVYPREVVKVALQHNAGAVILAHNHPSGQPEPSEADKSITRRLADALRLVDIRVLDHFVVTTTQTVSFAERGLL